MLNHRATLLQTVIRRLGPAPVDDIERRALLTFGTATFTLTMASPAAQHPARQIPVAFLHFLGAASFGLFLCLFPGGRFVPRWTGWVALV
jgi:peptidoglycan/LPS O-acetylase OafA/YrhL